MKLLFQKKKSTIISWLVSYISVLFVPVLISFFIFSESGKALENEINRANASLLKQVSQDINGMLENIERLMNEIVWDKTLQNLANKNEHDYQNYQFDIYTLVQHYKSLLNYYSFVDDFYIYLHNGGIILVPGALRPDKLFFDSYYSINNISFENWKDYMKDKHVNDTIPVIRQDEAGKRFESIAFISSIPAAGSEPPSATAVVIVDTSKLLQPLRNIQWIKGSNLYITGNNSELMASSATGMSDLYKALKLPDDPERLVYSNIKKERYAISYKSSSRFGWKYISIIPEKVFWEKSRYVRNLTYLSIFLSILAGMVLSYFFTRRNYYPLKRLIKAIGEKSGRSYSKELNEYSFIQNSMSVMVDEKEKLLRDINQHKGFLRSGFITRLLKGRIENNIPIVESLAMFDMRFETEYFAVILICFENMDDFIEKDDINPGEKYKLLQFTITNIFEELANRNNTGYVAEIENAMACLINFKEGNVDSGKQEMMNISNEAVQFLSKHFNIVLTISISGIHKSYAGISHAYNDALETMEYKLVTGSKTVVCYDDLPHEKQAEPKSNYYYPLLVEQQLINYIKTGDYENTRDTIETVFSRNSDIASTSVHIIKCLMFDLIGTMIKAVNEIGDSGCSTLFKKFDSMICLINNCSLIEIKTEILKTAKEVCEHIKLKIKDQVNKQKEKQGNKLITLIVAFICDNYMDTNLNISMIGEKFNLTPGYLSKLFKENTGEGLLDYTNIFRINKAKELLENPECSVNEACFNTGFSDINSFIRIFKRYEGVTPGKYREMKM